MFILFEPLVTRNLIYPNIASAGLHFTIDKLEGSTSIGKFESPNCSTVDVLVFTLNDKTSFNAEYIVSYE